MTLDVTAETSARFCSVKQETDQERAYRGDVSCSVRAWVSGQSKIIE